MSNELFTITKEKFTIPFVTTGISVEYPIAKPTSALINVLKNFDWKNPGNIDEVPHVIAKEYTLIWGQTVTNLQKILQIGQSLAENRIDPYLVMYSSKPTGFNYVFPYLVTTGTSIHNVTNTWATGDASTVIGVEKAIADSASKVANKATDWLTSLAGLGTGAMSNSFAGYGTEEIKTYQSTTNQSLTITFNLYNTISPESAYRNYRLITLLKFQNLKTRSSFMTYIPPKLYSITSPYRGGINMPVAQISTLSVISIGNSRVLSEVSSEVSIPEGYAVSITFEQLISESANIFQGTIDGSIVNVLGGNIPDLGSDPTQISNRVVDAFGKVVNKITGNAPPKTTP